MADGGQGTDLLIRDGVQCGVDLAQEGWVSESALVLRETSVATGQPESVARVLSEVPGVTHGGQLSGVLLEFAEKLADLGQADAATTLWATDLSLRCRPARELQLGTELAHYAAAQDSSGEFANALVRLALQLIQARSHGSAALLSAAVLCDRRTVSTAKRILAYTPRQETDRPDPSTLRLITKLAKEFARREKWSGASRLALMLIGLENGPDRSSAAHGLSERLLYPHRREGLPYLHLTTHAPAWNRLRYDADEELFAYFTGHGYPGVAAELCHPVSARGGNASARALWHTMESELESLTSRYELEQARRRGSRPGRDRPARSIEVWLETADQELQLAVAVRPTGDGRAGVPFHEPNWDGVESIDLVVVVESPALRFRTASQTAVLPRDGAMQPVRFAIVAGGDAGEACPVHISFYRASDLHLLEAVTVDIAAHHLVQPTGGAS